VGDDAEHAGRGMSPAAKLRAERVCIRFSLRRSDSRFQGYYDRKTPGCAEFLKQAILFWADASVAESE